MSIVRSIRVASVVAFAFAFSLAACSHSSVPSSPSSSSPSASPTATGTGSNSIPGGGFGGGTNVAYVPAYIDQNVYIYNFATESFATVPIVGTANSSSNNGLYGQGAALSADGQTLYSFSLANSGAGSIAAYTVSATGATLLGTVSATFGDHNQVVPSASSGNVYAFTRAPSNGATTLSAVYGPKLGTTVVSPTALAISGAFEYGATNPVNANAYVVDGLGNLYEIDGASVLSTIAGVSSYPADNSAIDGQQLVAVNPNGRFVYTFQTVDVPNSTAIDSYIDVFSVNPLAMQTQISVPFTYVSDLMTNATTNELYIVGGETVGGAGVSAIGAVGLSSNALGTVSQLQGASGVDTAEVSADGTKLIVQGANSIDTQYTVFSTSSGAQVGKATIPGTGAYAATGFIATH